MFIQSNHLVLIINVNSQSVNIQRPYFQTAIDFRRFFTFNLRILLIRVSTDKTIVSAYVFTIINTVIFNKIAL